MSRMDKPSPTDLTSAEVLTRRQQFGENRLPAEKATPIWTILLNQVKSPLVYIILVAALVSLFAKEYSDFAIIMAVVVIDVILGFIQEYQAQKTYSALKGLLKPTTTVIRDGTRQEVEVRELVPGDRPARARVGDRARPFARRRAARAVPRRGRLRALRSGLPAGFAAAVPGRRGRLS